MTELHAPGRSRKWSVCLVGMAALWCALACGPAYANDYFVDPVNGSDTTGQGTSASPWKSITFALSQITPPTGPASHTLHLGAGLFDTASGELFPITVPPGINLEGVDNAQSIIYGNNVSGQALIRFVGTHDARSGLCDVGVSAGDPGIEIATSGTAGPVLDRCRLQWNDVGLTIISSNGSPAPVIQHSSFFSQQNEAIRLIGASSGCVGGSISACRIDNNTGSGLDIDGRSGAVCTQITNCTLIGNSVDGVTFQGDMTSTAVITHCTVRANTNAGIRAVPGSEMNSLTIRNTITYESGTFDFDNVQTTNVQHCCFATSRGASRPMPGQNGNISQNPRFDRVGEPDIRSDSPVIDLADTGAAVDPSNDLDGDSRSIDGDGDATHTPDMGADEFTPLWTSGLAPLPGGFTSFHVDLPTNTSISYLIGLSFTAGGIPVAGQRRIPLWPDPLLALVLSNQLPFVKNFAGLMNPSGFATGRIDFPNDARLRGIRFHAAAVTLQQGFPGGVRCVTNGLALTIQ